MKKLYSALYHDNCHPFNALCSNIEVASDPDHLKEHDAALIVWGGSDISPTYYNHPLHSTTYPGGARDRAEWSLMQRAIEMGMTIIGVCRGAQMGCAASGGYLLQDVEGHHGRHEVTTIDGEKFVTNSIHHQMLMPLDVEHELVAWSSTNLSKRHGYPYYGYKQDELFTPPEGWKEPEYVYFKKTNIHAIQWHPEMMAKDSAATQYVLSYINKKQEELRERNVFPSCEC